MSKFTRCPGSANSQMLAWFPDDDVETLEGKPYPGAVVCIRCSFGVLVVRGSVHEAVSQTGYEGLAGKVRVHYVNRSKDEMSYRAKKGR